MDYLAPTGILDQGKRVQGLSELHEDGPYNLFINQLLSPINEYRDNVVNTHLAVYPLLFHFTDLMWLSIKV